ncbi:hypothetical protein RBB50_011770 [Rhinocladiella similis]
MARQKERDDMGGKGIFSPRSTRKSRDCDNEEETQNHWAKVVAHADAAGLQCAIHTIGDRAITQAINAFARLDQPWSRRQGIEHLELTSAEDAKRLGELGIIASVQPVSASVCVRVVAGASVVFGADASTATHLSLRNFNRRRDSEMEELAVSNSTVLSELTNAEEEDIVIDNSQVRTIPNQRFEDAEDESALARCAALGDSGGNVRTSTKP